MTTNAIQFWLCVLCTLLGSTDGQINRMVSGMVPRYGPQAGGTNVVIIGGNFTGLLSVGLEIDGGMTEIFDITSKTNDTLIHCISPNVSEAFINVSYPIVLSFNDSQKLRTPFNFTYLQNPIIEDVSPRKSILRGGTEQTIRGRHLDSVFLPLLTMTLVVKSRDHTIEYEQMDVNLQEAVKGVCRVENSTLMFCNSKPFTKYPSGTIPPHHPETGINTDNFQIYVGFRLDGVVAFQNFSIINIFDDPKFSSDPEDIIPFNIYKNQLYIELMGQSFTFGTQKKDFRVQIGDSGVCEVSEVITNQLRCRPPVPCPEGGALGQKGKPRILVTVGYSTQHVGYLHCMETLCDDTQLCSIIIAVPVVFVLLLFIVTVTVVVVKRKHRQEDERRLVSNSYVPNPFLIPDDMKPILDPCIKEESRLKLGKRLGEGNFGAVHAGKFINDEGNTILVAAKTLKESGVTRTEYREFLEEATFMRDFDHEHVLNLVGVVFKQGRPFVLLPYMENGDLRTFLLNENNCFTVENLLDYGQQIASGMSYMEASKIVHRDLAARNCMVSKDNVVKVADFGLARDINQDDYYRVEQMGRALPIKWMAPESMETFKFTSKSDVWSFGVLLWELLTRGRRPYAHVDNFELKRFLLEGRRLDKPAVAPDEVYDMMLRTWHINPNARPSFFHLDQELQQVLQSEEQVAPYEGVERRNRSDNTQPAPYQVLSRYVDSEDRHAYVRLSTDYISPEPEGASRGIDYKAAKKDFDDIEDPHADDGYIPPTDVENDPRFHNHANNTVNPEVDDGYIPPSVVENDPRFHNNNNVSDGYMSPHYVSNGGVNNQAYLHSTSVPVASPARDTRTPSYLSPTSTTSGTPNVKYINMEYMASQGQQQHVNHDAINVNV